MNQLSERMKLLRSRKGLLQKELAAALNCSISAISGYENGRCEPSLDSLVEIAHFYNVSADYLLGLTDLPNPVDKKLHFISKGYPVSHFLRLLNRLSSKNRSFLAYGLLLFEKAIDRQES